MQELIAYAKANPGKVSYGSAGVGTVQPLCGEYFALRRPASRSMHVPYKGTGPALTDLVGGHVPMCVRADPGDLREFQERQAARCSR